MRIWISGGGTAGHVYPALTVLDGLRASGDDIDAMWLGTAGSLEARIAARRGLAFCAVPAAPIVGVRSPWRLARHVARLAAGVVVAWRALRRGRPDVVLVTGGYVSVPVAVAARAAGVPLAVYLPDARPGRAVALVARLAERVAVTTARAARYFAPEKVVVTGYPVREAVRRAERGAARERLDLPDDAAVVLVFGGSQGARRLNRAVADAAPRLLGRAVLVHVAGPRGHAAAAARRDALPSALRQRYVLAAYLHDDNMAAALAAADLVVSRAGASSLGELPARSLPSILVPLPIAGGHQADNAAVLVDAGAALCEADATFDGRRLATRVTELLDDPDRLAAMSRAARALDHPEAARDIGSMLRRMVRPKGGAR